MPDADNSRKAQVLLVEDHPMLRERLAQLINSNLDMEVCGDADNAQDAMALIKDRNPEIAIVDISLRGSNGLELLKELRKQGIRTRVLVLSMHDEVIYAQRALAAGAQGFVTKTEASAEVMRAIRKVLNGEIYVNERMTSELIQAMSGCRQESRADRIVALSDRELQVFRLIGQGANTHEIARRLRLDESTIATRRVRIKQKVGVKDVAALYHLAAQWMREREAAPM